MTVITMPKLSDTMEEGKVIRWLKHEGDQVIEGESIAEIETDKANVEMESFEAGILKQLIAPEGETLAVGEPIAEMEAAETAAAPEAPPEAAPVQEREMIPVAKAPEPYAAEQVPTVTTPPPPEAAEPAPKAEEAPSAEVPEEERIKASPLARKIAEEKGIDLAEIQGSGPGGRIVESDVEEYVRAEAPPAPAAEVPAKPKHPTPPTELAAEEREQTKMRKTIGERMMKSKQTIPHFYVTSEIEMDWEEKVREELNADESQTRISVTDMVIKACALALREFPEVNAFYTDGKLLMHEDINIGVAVAVEGGLVVPVVRNADRMPIREISARTKELAKRARENRLHSSDYTGSTFTVSNLGMFDVESFISIINPPESASIAIGSIRETPVVADGMVVVSKRMKATLSSNHRVLDGAVAAKFLQVFKKKLESPLSLIS